MAPSGVCFAAQGGGAGYKWQGTLPWNLSAVLSAVSAQASEVSNFT